MDNAVAGETLLPCPYDGASASTDTYPDGSCLVTCSKCDARQFGTTRTVAIESWNRRTPVQPTAGQRITESDEYEQLSASTVAMEIVGDFAAFGWALIEKPDGFYELSQEEGDAISDLWSRAHAWALKYAPHRLEDK